MDRVLPPSKLVKFVMQFKAQYYSRVMSLLLINAHTDVAGASSVGETLPEPHCSLQPHTLNTLKGADGDEMLSILLNNYWLLFFLISYGNTKNSKCCYQKYQHLFTWEQRTVCITPSNLPR